MLLNLKLKKNLNNLDIQTFTNLLVCDWTDQRDSGHVMCSVQLESNRILKPITRLDIAVDEFVHVHVLIISGLQSTGYGC